ncbi:MAG: hypothetical protein ACREJQ_05650 [bacterium]
MPVLNIVEPQVLQVSSVGVSQVAKSHAGSRPDSLLPPDSDAPAVCKISF